MITKEKLRSYRALIAKREALLELSEQIYDTYKSPAFTSNGGHSSEPGSPVEQALKEKERLEQKIYEVTSEINETLDEIIEFLKSVDDEIVAKIIRYKYIDGLTWSQVSMKIYSTTNGWNSANMAFRRYCKDKGIT